MNGWDALQAYDLVNDGHGNYQFHNTAQRRDNGSGGLGTGLKFLWDALLVTEEAAHRRRKEGA